eukprot:2547679-Prymnesium_polylepis.1
MSVIASTSLGAVRGVRLASGVSQWLGVQYATAARWQAPIDVSAPYPEDGYTASTYGPNCPQKAGQVFNASYSSEECLYIQGIWSPPASTPEPAPVMVWFHGGGFAFGGGADFNGSALARHGVMVITVNYRLGAL